MPITKCKCKNCTEKKKKRVQEHSREIKLRNFLEELEQLLERHNVVIKEMGHAGWVRFEMKGVGAYDFYEQFPLLDYDLPSMTLEEESGT